MRTTRIEVLSVAATTLLALLIVLPGLAQVRRNAMRTLCATNLHQFGIGQAIYSAEQLDYLPGVNTSGVAQRGIDLEDVPTDDPAVPVQSWDWQGPLASILDPGYAGNRAERWQQLLTDYHCPANNAVTDSLFGEPSDRADFDALGPLPASSYLSSTWFHLWGRDVTIIDDPKNARIVTGRTPGSNWEVRLPRPYRARLAQVGPPDRKAFAMDGTRFLDSALDLDISIRQDEALLGAFTSFGPWYSGSTGYGVALGSLDWADRETAEGSPSDGANLALSYRRGLHTGPQPTSGGTTGTASPGSPASGDPLARPVPDGSVRGNTGTLNVLFFDGSVRNLNDRQSRTIEYWYPSGSVVQNPAAGLTQVAAGFEIP